MFNKKGTKHALLMSVLSLLLCCSMLIGTTFAWFTDSVESLNNKIVSGNLDVELYNGLDKNAPKVGNNTPLFEEVVLWEPGVVAYENLTVSNEGTLALKYALSVNFTNENATTDGYKLSQKLQVAFVPGGIAETLTREQVIEVGKDYFAPLTSFTENGALLPTDNDHIDPKPEGAAVGTKTYGIIIYWEPAENDNNWNVYNGKTTTDGDPLHIYLGVNLFATQLMAEDDSFGPDYDEQAPNGVNSITANGKTYETIDAAMADGATTIYISGKHSFTAARAGQNTEMSNVTIIGVSGDATIEFVGNGGGISNVNLKNLSVIDSTFYTSENGENAWEFTYLEIDGNNTFENVEFTDGIIVEGGHSEFVNCSFSGHNNDSSDLGTTTMYGAWVYSGSANFTGCDFSGTRGLKVADQYSGSDVTNVVVDDCFFGPLSEKPGVAVDNRLGSLNLTIKNSVFAGTQPGDGADDASNGVPYIYENDNRTPDVTTITLENNTIADFVDSSDSLNDAIAAGETTIALGSGTYIIPDSAKGKTLTIIGSGDTVIASQDDGAAEGDGDYSFDGATVTFENVTITTSTTYFPGYVRMKGIYNNCTINGVYTLYDNSVFNNCTFNVSGDVYNVWTWGATEATFNGCTFNNDGKAILLYGTVNTKLTLNNCVFNDNGGLTDLKAAVEIGNDYGKSYELIVNNTVVNGYEINDKGICTFSTLWANKNSMGTDKLTVTVDDVQVYGPENTKTIYIDSAAGLFAFANDVNVNKNNYSGKTVALTKDIDLNNEAWTPIGQTGATEFKGIFDGNGYTIKNLNIDNSAATDEHTSSGLFGWAESNVTIKNVKVDGAKVVGNHYVAVIVGYTYSGKISNCHVTNANIVCNHANDDACGDKCGLIVGYAADESRITDCSASNSTVKAGRDAGQLVGCGYNVSMSNCSATNVTVEATGECTGKNINVALIGRVMG